MNECSCDVPFRVVKRKWNNFNDALKFSEKFNLVKYNISPLLYFTHARSRKKRVLSSCHIMEVAQWYETLFF